MPEIDLGVDFESVKDADEFFTVPTGEKQFVVKSSESAIAVSTQRPMLKWTITVQDPESGKDCNIFVNTVLPFMENGTLVTSGIFQLVAICKCLGMPWTGSKIIPENYIGRSGAAKIKQVPAQTLNPATGQYEDDLTKPPRNDVEKFLYETDADNVAAQAGQST